VEGGGRRDSGCRQGGAPLHPTDVYLSLCGSGVNYVTAGPSWICTICTRRTFSASYISMELERRKRGSALPYLVSWMMGMEFDSDQESGVPLANRNDAKANYRNEQVASALFEPSRPL